MHAGPSTATFSIVNLHFGGKENSPLELLRAHSLPLQHSPLVLDDDVGKDQSLISDPLHFKTQVTISRQVV